MGVQKIRHNGAAIAVVAGFGALLAACGSQNSGFARADAPNAVAAQPVAVSCEPNQRAVVRQTAVNGVLQAQVQCESVGAVANGYAATNGLVAAPAATPVGYQTGFQPATYPPAPVGYGAAGVTPIENTRVVPATYPSAQPAVVTRSTSRPVTYQRAPERVVRPKRSVAKSAVIIGSSAGIGAGVGAAVGGKKGAGIGALIGGGGAALWDQITRRQQ